MNTNSLKEQIILTSREVFAKFGFKKTSVEGIAQNLHKKKSSIYYYFNSKEDIFEAVLDYEANILRQEIIKKLLEHKKASDKLKEYVHTRMLYLKKMINFYDALKNDYFNHMPFIEKIRKKFDDEEIGIIRSILVEGVVTNEFSLKRPDLAALAVFTAMKGLEIIFMQDDTDLKDRLNNLMDILFYGIKKK